MKILKLRFNHLNSLSTPDKGGFTIDFTQGLFKDTGLFAITGLNGAGKSTILDAITMALYRKSARYDNENNPEGMISYGQDRCWSELTIEIDNKIYEFRSEIRLNSNSHKAIIQNLTDQTIIAEKISDFKTIVENTLIGLKYEQFTKTILLAQGNFTAFLNAEPAEKAEILSKITDGGIYKVLSKTSHEKTIKAKELRTFFENELKSFSGSVLGEEQLNVLTQEQLTINGKIQQLEQTTNQLIEQRQKLKALNQAEQDFHIKDLALNKVLEEISKHETHFQRLEMHQKAVPVKTFLNKWEEQQTLDKNLQTEYSTKLQSKSDLELSKNEAEKRFSLQNETHENLRKQSKEFEPKLTRAFQIESLLNDRQKLRQELVTTYTEKKKELENTLKKQNTALKHEFSTQEIEAKLNNINKQITETLAGKEPQVFERELKEIEEKIHKTDLLLRDISALEEEQTAITTLQNKLNDLEKQKNEIEPQFNQVEALLFTENQRLEALQKLLSIEKERANLEDKRLHLIDGEPCPLCGALHHPFAENQPRLTVSDDNIMQSKKLIQQLESEKITFINRLGEVSGKINTDILSLEDTKNKLSLLHVNIKEQNNLIQAQFPLVDRISCEKFKEILKVSYDMCNIPFQTYRQLISDKENLTDMLLIEKKKTELKDVEDQGKKIKTEIEQYKAEKNNLVGEKDCNVIQEEWQQNINSAEMNLNSARKEAEDRKLELEKLITQLETLERTVEQYRQNTVLAEQELKLNLLDSGFSDVDTLKKHLLSPQEEKFIADKKEHLKNEKTAAAALKASAWKELEVKRSETITEKGLEIINFEIEECKQESAKAREKIGEIKEIIRKHDEYKESIAKKEIEFQKADAEWRKWSNLNELIGSEKGTKFERFAQKLTLSRLTESANFHLSELSKRYRIIYTDFDEKNELELEIEDLLQASTKRAIKSLSGGEKFLISLAMALGLSDLAGGKSRIQNLFIDEGFGSLDPQNLELTLSTLDALQSQGKMIGIISHVPELNERIPVRIQVEKQNSGFSTLSGV